MSESRLVQGNEACALGALAAGCTFFGGYPITPSSEIAEYMVSKLPEAGGTFVQMEDEIASLGAVIGASVGGAKAMTATSGPGFSLMQEHIGYATITEVPCVVVNVMRGGPSTGLPTSPSQGDVMQARWGTHGDHPAIVLAPASVDEVFHLTVRAFNLAERLRTPVTVLYDEVIGHTRESVSLPEEVEVEHRRGTDVAPEDFLPFASGADDIPPMPAFGDGYRYHLTGLVHDERGFPSTESDTAGALISRLHRKVEARRDDIVEVELYRAEDADVVIFAYGIVARAAREAVDSARAAGARVGMIRPITLWPFPTEAVCELAERVDGIVVAEMNLGQMLHEVRASAGSTPIIEHLRADGEPIAPAELLEALSAYTPTKTGGSS
ncbi:MAG: 2-oxoacid:acceptor oxidoreductase subunit alpha [Acidimicrobiia bacterium]